MYDVGKALTFYACVFVIIGVAIGSGALWLISKIWS